MTSDNSSSVSGLSQEELTAHLVRTRAELAATLDAVEEKVNVPKRLDRAAVRLKAKLRTMRQENPVALAAIGAGTIATVGLFVYAGYRSVTRR
jgi:hypothetical protein